MFPIELDMGFYWGERIRELNPMVPAKLATLSSKFEEVSNPLPVQRMRLGGVTAGSRPFQAIQKTVPGHNSTNSGAL